MPIRGSRAGWPRSPRHGTETGMGTPASPPTPLQRELAIAALASRQPSSAMQGAGQGSGGSGRQPPARRRVAQKSFAQALREVVTPEEHARWLYLFSQGIDPDKPEGAPGMTNIDARLRYQARIAMIEFAYGTAPQRVQVEAEIRASLAPAVDVDLSKLSDAELAQFRELRRKMIGAAPRDAIDVEAGEAPRDAGGEDA